jgi:hypothetical protein
MRLFLSLVCIGIAAVTFGQGSIAVCDFNASFRTDAKRMFTLLDTLNYGSLTTFIDGFVNKKNFADTDSVISAIKNHVDSTRYYFPEDETGTSFTCNTNKELTDYVMAATLLKAQMKAISGRSELSSFEYANVITAYQQLIIARSHLMAIMDACLKHLTILDFQQEQKQKLKNIGDSLRMAIVDIDKSKKETKRTVRLWSGLCAGLTTIVAILVIKND